MPSLYYEGVLVENPNLAEALETGQWMPDLSLRALCTIPQGVENGVPPDVYNAYRRGRDSACVDIVFATHLPNGKPAVLFSFRKKGVCFEEKWWIYGGALQSYCSIHHFISDRAEKECGVRASPQALVGVYRTMSDDAIGSTLQPCYATIVPYEEVRKKKQLDSGHNDVRLFTLEELEQIPEEHKHWYPMRVAKLVLLAMDSLAQTSRANIDGAESSRSKKLEMDHLLQVLWTKAVGTHDYSKKEWLELQRKIWEL